MDDFNGKIRKMASNATYTQKYGMDLLIAICLVILFVFSIIYFNILNSFIPIKKNWVNERCKPSVMPFAGLINKPDDETATEFTINNFNQCTIQLLNDLSKYLLQPFYFILFSVISQIKALSSTTISFRELIAACRQNIGDANVSSMDNFKAYIISLRKYIITSSDLTHKLTAFLRTCLYSIKTAFFLLVSFFKIIFVLIRNILIILAITIIVLWVIFFALVSSFFGAPLAIAFKIAAIATTIIMVAIIVVFLLIISFMKNTLKVKTKPIPKVPQKKACFDGNTMVKLLNNKTVPFKNLQVGDILEDNSYITTFLKFTSYGSDLYILNNIIVTGNHRVYDESLGLIRVDKHPNSIYINDYREPYIYCINTSNKNIIINNTTFVDWDNIDNNDIIDLHVNCSNKGLLPHNFSKKDIHTYLSSGFFEDSIIQLDDGRSVKIKDIEVNDVLKHGERIIGTIKIYAYDINDIYEFYLDNNIIKCTNNIEINYKLGNINTTKLQGNKLENIMYIYNLITDKGTFYVDNINVMDYTNSLNQHLKKHIYSYNNFEN